MKRGSDVGWRSEVVISRHRVRYWEAGRMETSRVVPCAVSDLKRGGV